MAYHCGSSRPDPASGRVYTDWAREKIGRFAGTSNSPNNATLGIELCVIDAAGNFSNSTYAAAVELVAKLIKDNGLTVNEIGTHNLVVGWKDCPRLWTEHPGLFEAFCQAVKAM